ncbi:unnamed protein product [Pleuronectes platessa]|uniref:Uncharacterized protein n=1 Tax=Pleuronectes platessa TaxID=8262 RepID=A0A9N7VEG7_PLEPL|nr:unnamed protein product [Pleuronectes platessa]
MANTEVSDVVGIQLKAEFKRKQQGSKHYLSLHCNTLQLQVKRDFPPPASLACGIVVKLCGDELHKSLSGVLTEPGELPCGFRHIWSSPPPPPRPLRLTAPIPHNDLHKWFQRGSALITGL